MSRDPLGICAAWGLGWDNSCSWGGRGLKELEAETIRGIFIDSSAVDNYAGVISRPCSVGSLSQKPT